MAVSCFTMIAAVVLAAAMGLWVFDGGKKYNQALLQDFADGIGIPDPNPITFGKLVFLMYFS